MPGARPDMARLAQLRGDLGLIATDLSLATDSIYAALAGASVDEHRAALHRVTQDLTESWRAAVQSYAGIRDLMRELDAAGEQLPSAAGQAGP